MSTNTTTAMPIAQSRIFFQERPGRPAVLAMRGPSVGLRCGRLYSSRRTSCRRAVADGVVWLPAARPGMVTTAGRRGTGGGRRGECRARTPLRRRAREGARGVGRRGRGGLCRARRRRVGGRRGARPPVRPPARRHASGRRGAGGAGRAGPRRRRHPPAPLPAHGRRHAAGRRLERVPRAAGRALLRGVVRAARGAAARARLRRVRRRPRRVPRGRARGRRRRAHAGRRVVPLRRPAARGRRRAACGPATTRSPGRPACCSTPARATTSRPRTSPASAASSRTGWSPRRAADVPGAALRTAQASRSGRRVPSMCSIT